MRNDIPFNVLRHARWEIAPRDPVTVGTAILGSLGVSTATIATIGGVAITNAAIVGYLATTAITSWAMSALTPDIPSGAPNSSGILVNATDPVAPAEFVYGRVRKGGVVTYYESASNGDKSDGYLYQIIVLAAHEVHEVETIYLNDQVATVSSTGYVTSQDWNSKVRIWVADGSQTTNSDTFANVSNTIEDMQNEILPGSSFIGKNVAYLYVRYEYDKDALANGLPTITTVIKGKKLFDPRDDSTAFSANAALVIRDYISSAYGLDDDSIDDTSFQAAANECDESVTTINGSESRYEINGIVKANQAPGGVLERMSGACAGTLFYGAGKWKLKPGAYSTPVKSLGLDDLRSAISIDAKINMRDNFNTIRGTFIDAAQGWVSADYPEVTSSTFVTEDGGDEVASNLDFPFTTSATMARRLAKLTLYRTREQITFTADFGMEAFELEVGDIIEFTHARYGWTDKEFEVVGWQLQPGETGDLRVSLSLRETSEAAFSWNSSEEGSISANNTSLPSYTSGLTINNLQVGDGGNTQSDGTFLQSALVSWNAVDSAFINYYEIEWKRSTDSSYASTQTVNNSIELGPIQDGVEYTIRVRAASSIGNRGPQASVTFTGGGDTTAPGAPTGFSAAGILGGIELNWTNPADADFSHVEIYEAASNSFSAASEIARTSGSRFARMNLGPNVTKYYWIRAVDLSGNPGTPAESQFTGPQSSTTTRITAGDLGDAVIPFEAIDADFEAAFNAKAETSDLSDYVPLTDYNLSVDAVQELEDQASNLATKALDLALKASSLESRINDAGIVVDPDDGSVSIQAVSSLEQTVNNLSVDLDAAEAAITLRATTTYVDNAVAAAVLDSADLASLNNLETRVDDVEISIDGGGDIIAASAMVAGTAYTIYTVGTTPWTNYGAPSGAAVGTTFYATGAGTGTGQVQEAGATARIGLVASGLVFTADDGELSISEMQGEIDVLEGAVSLKASTSDLNSLSGRVTTTEQDIAAIDAASITQNLIDIQGVAEKIDDLSELSLREVLGRYNDRKFLNADIAIARTQLTADVTDQKTALAEQKLELSANIDANTASIVANQTAIADEETARINATTSLQASIDGVDSKLDEVITLDSTADHAIVSQFLSLQADVTNTDTGLAAAHADLTQLNLVDVTSTSALVTAHLELDGQVNDATTGLPAATAAIDEINNIDVNSTSAAASSIASLEATVGDNSSGLVASVNSINDVSADSDSSVAQAVAALQVSVGDANSGLVASVNSINDVSADSSSSVAQAVAALEVSVGDADSGLVASVNSINNVSADSDSDIAQAVAGLQTALELNDGTFGKITEISSLTTTVGDADGGLVADVSSLETTVGGADSGLVQSVTNIEAKYGVTLDVNGVITGFQILDGSSTASAFNVRADQFNVYGATQTPSDTDTPLFTVRTAAETIDGVTYPAGTYFEGTIYGGNIEALEISADTLTVDQISDFSSTLGTFTNTTDDGEVIISGDGIIVKDADGNVRVKIGNLA